MKLITMAGIVLLILVAAVAGQGVALHRRAEKIGELQQSLKKAEDSLAEEKKRGEIYRRRVETLQQQNDKLNQSAADDAAQTEKAISKNHEWSSEKLPADVAAAVNRKK